MPTNTGKIYLGDTLISKPSTGTIQITENGVINVSDYANADVNVSNDFITNKIMGTITGNDLGVVANASAIPTYTYTYTGNKTVSACGIILSPYFDNGAQYVFYDLGVITTSLSINNNTFPYFTNIPVYVMMGSTLSINISSNVLTINSNLTSGNLYVGPSSGYNTTLIVCFVADDGSVDYDFISLFIPEVVIQK